MGSLRKWEHNNFLLTHAELLEAIRQYAEAQANTAPIYGANKGKKGNLVIPYTAKIVFGGDGARITWDEPAKIGKARE